ncbi:MAG TPA: enolase C-terminal domain-like protein [Parachlamydiaceae bacterium]|nr:enolase C-terminal domain-like protein [Parachlamydiaceae bacterium]
MEIGFSKYQLFPAGNSGNKPREGALLKVLQKDGQFGYSDCHPWFELGDAPLQEQLDLIASGRYTSLTSQSLLFAQIDAQARRNQINLFKDLQTPQNHYHISTGNLLTDELMERLANAGIRLIKVKVGNHFHEDCAMLHRTASKLRSSNLKLRLDFNCKFDQRLFLEFLSQCSQQLDIVDFFEDPFPYDPDAWQTTRERYPVQLACDRESLRAISFPQSCDYLVVKPAIQDVTPFLTHKTKGRRLVLTSYLDHPIGQLSGLYTASTILKSHPELLSDCGFLSHHAYIPTLFTSKFNFNGSQLFPSTEGTGFGFDNLLKELKWEALR